MVQMDSLVLLDHLDNQDCQGQRAYLVLQAFPVYQEIL